MAWVLREFRVGLLVRVGASSGGGTGVDGVLVALRQRRHAAQRHMRAMKRRYRYPILRITTGWGACFGNRWTGIHYHWFRIRTMRTYRNA
jgi:hypothetical protein